MRAPNVFLFDSGDKAVTDGWAFLVAEPSRLLEYRGGKVLIDGQTSDVPPLTALRTFQRSAHSRNADQRKNAVPDTFGDRWPPFCSGIAGFVGYEVGGALEPGATGPQSPYELPDMVFGDFDAVAAFDKDAKRLFITGRDRAAIERHQARMSSLGTSRTPLPKIALQGTNFSEQSYCDAVTEVRRRILLGEVYQVNISQQIYLQSENIVHDGDLFDAITEQSSSKFCAVLRTQDGSIISNSPERFFRLRNTASGRQIITDPIKGTRPRHSDPVADKAAARELIEDPKERAENIMITDLLRNDLSKICTDTSVKEDYICKVKSYSNVHHLVSRISGYLGEGAGAIDALAGLFPCGSITGAPKIAAMQAIASIEGVGRGPYCGAIGYVDDGGDAEFSVAIRTLVLNADGKRMTTAVGGGVTYKSVPQLEYQESLAKAQGILGPLRLGNAFGA